LWVFCPKIPKSRKHLTTIPNIGIFVKKVEMSKNTSVTLGEHFEQIIEKGIKSGRYASASEVIREGLRLVDEREQKIKILREAIEAGEKSGYVKNFDPVKHLEKLNQSYKK
jgi:antitoxin ParD1/3/4